MTAQRRPAAQGSPGQRRGGPWPSLPVLAVLWLGFRLGALMLYRPGGYLAVAPPYAQLPAWLLTALPGTTELTHQLVLALALLPFEGATIALLAWLARRAWSEARARRTVLLWLLTAMPLVRWLQGLDPIWTTLCLGFLALLWHGRSSRWGAIQRWGWIGGGLHLLALGVPSLFPAALALTILVKPTLPVTGLLIGASLLAALATDAWPVWGMAGGGSALLLQGGRLALVGVLAWELSGHRHRTRARWATRLLLAAGALWLVGFLVVAAGEYRQSRLAASPFQPLAAEWESAAPGMVLMGDWDLHDELYAWGGTRHLMRVVTERNQATLLATLATHPGQVWVIQRAGADPGALAPVIDALAASRSAPASQSLGGSEVLRFEATSP